MDTQPIHVLLVEDNPGDARFVREMVREVPDLSIHHVDRLATAIEHLATQKVDVVLLDLGLPDSQGLETLRTIIKTGCAVPVVVLTGHDDEAVGQAAVREGAQDYLVKGRVADQALTRAVRYAIERQRAQAHILEQHATLSAILEGVDFPIFSLDREYRYTSFNRAHAAVMKALYGTDIQLGGRLAEYQTVPEDWQAARTHIDRTLQGETVLESASSGDEGLSRRYFEVAHHPVRTDAGQIIGVSVFAREVTAHKRAEAELHFKNLILSTEQEASIDGILVVDENAQILSFNHRFVEMWDIPPELVEMRADAPVLRFVAEQVADPGPFLQRVQYLYEHPRDTCRDEVHLKSGRTFDRYSAPMLGPDSRYYGRVWYFRDVTERKQAEAHMAEQLDELRRWHQATLGREGRVLDLKKEVNELLAKAGEPPRYASALEEEK